MCRLHLPLTLRACLLMLALYASISNAIAATKEKVLYAFQGGADGSLPVAGLILDQLGNLYGTTAGGGVGNSGTVFELTRAGTRWNNTVLYNFTGGSDGGSPLAPLIFDVAGNLYGTTSQGGYTKDFGSGVVFELIPSPIGWSETVIYTFGGYNNTGYGASPTAGVKFDSSNHIWGTAAGNSVVASVAFELVRSSGSWTENYFSNGTNSLGGLVLDRSGHLYGASQRLFNGYGSIYELTQSSKGWSVTTLYNFTGGIDGSYPGYGDLLLDRAGNLYGTTEYGGAYGYGVVFELSSSQGRPETVLYNFTGNSDGAYPLSGLTFDSAGDLMGTTEQGGTSGYGTVYKLTRGSSGQWSESVLHSFSGGTDGTYPIAGVVRDSKGELYGTTQYGGIHNDGVAYVIEP